MSFKGTVQRINSNPWNGKLLHSFTLNSERGFFNLGTKQPSFKEGDQLEFEAKPAKRQGNFDVDFNSVKVVGQEQVAPQDYQMASGARKTQVLQKDDYWNRKEERDILNQKIIQLQAARNTAIALAELRNKVDPFADVDGMLEYIDGQVTSYLETNSTVA